MPRIRKDLLSRSATFIALQKESYAAGDSRDCTVKALAIACGVPYALAHDVMQAAGRRFGHGADLTIAEFERLGKTLVPVNPRDIIATYPKPHQVLKSVTSYHPHRFRRSWKNGKTYVAFTRGHVLAIVDGVTHDWSHASALRVSRLFEVVDLSRKEN